MAGFATYDKGGGVPGTVVYADNVDFTGTGRTNTITTNGQLLIGATTANAGGNHINVGHITSPLGTLSIGYSSPNITIDLSGGSTGVDSFAVQTGTSPVVPTVAGEVTLSGAVTAAGTNPVRTDGTGPNTIAIEVQTSQALAAADATKIGLSNFSSTDFSVAATGFVTLSTTGAAKTITGDSGGALSPTANNWNLLGSGSITTSGSGSTLTTQLTGLTNHAVLVGAGTSTITKLSVGTTGQLLVGATAADPAFASSATGDFTFTSATAGATRTFTVSNTDNTNASSTALIQTTVGGGSAGDPFHTFTVTGATSWSQGIDNSVSDTFVLSASTALGTTNVMSATTGGAVSFVLGNVDVTKSASGADVSVTASNTSNTASSTATHYATVAGTSAGDAQVQYAVSGTTTWTQGIDNSVSGDPFVLAASSALGTTNVMSATTGGAVSFVLGDVDVTRSSSGATVTSTVSNTSNTASSNALSQHTVAGTSAGDAFSTYTVSGTTNWSLGVDNSVTGDPFVVAASTALGTTNIMSALTTGEINYPLQPAFLAYLPTNDNNKTGNSASFTIGSATALTEVFDQNSDFNTNGTFTAPVTGRYFISGTVYLTGCTINQAISVNLITSNRNYQNSTRRAASSLDNVQECSVLADMDAADTYTLLVVGIGEAADTDDIQGLNGSTLETYMSGYLAC